MGQGTIPPPMGGSTMQGGGMGGGAMAFPPTGTGQGQWNPQYNPNPPSNQDLMSFFSSIPGAGQAGGTAGSYAPLQVPGGTGGGGGQPPQAPGIPMQQLFAGGGQATNQAFRGPQAMQQQRPPMAGAVTPQMLRAMGLG